MKLKVKIEEENKKSETKFTDEDLPLVTVNSDTPYLIYKDDNVYKIIDLNDGLTMYLGYNSLEELINDLDSEEKIVEAELIIKEVN